MKTEVIKASIMLESRTFQAMLQKVMDEYHIESQLMSHANDLLNSTQNELQPDLIFISKESTLKVGIDPIEFIHTLRKSFQGPILLISTEQELEHIEKYISAGVTDVFSPTEFVQIDNFVSNFVAYKHAAASEDKAKVLLVEDSKSITTLISELFEKNNIEVMFIPTAREALTVLHFEQVDLVITDYMLEGDMTGLSLIRNIRRTTQWYDLPILAITGYIDTERNKELMRNGVSDILHKPFDLELFLIKCQNLIRNKRTFQKLIDKQQEITELLQTDPGTGLYNRQYLMQQFETAQKELPPKGALYLIQLDCDDFELVNQQFNHVIADSLLRDMGQYIKSTIGHKNIAARIEGDKFLVLLPNSELDTALQVADMLREGIAQQLFNDIQITVSVGVTGGGETSEYSSLHQDSENAVKQAKSQGKNKVILGELLEL